MNEYDQLMQTVPDCLICAVRQLTEGNGPPAELELEGESVGGVVLKVERFPYHDFAESGRAVTLWTGGTGRVRAISYAATFRAALESAAPQVGDRLTITRLADATISNGRFQGRPYSQWEFAVERGHH